MPESLILIAAGGLAREVMDAVEAGGQFVVEALLDDDPTRQGTTVRGVPIVGPPESSLDHPDAQLVVCAGSGLARSTIVARLTAIGVEPGRYASIRHPSVAVPASCSVGGGTILLANVVLTADVTLGRHVVAMPHAVFTHDDRADDCATICAGVSLGGDVRLGRASYLGMNSSVREHCVVGDNTVLGMGSALLQDLPDDQTWVGTPARPINRLVSAL